MEVGILTDALLSDLKSLPILQENELTKGVVLELNDFQTKNSISWEQFYGWLEQLCPAASLPSLPAIKVKLYRLRGSLTQLKRNKQHEKLSVLSYEPFIWVQQCLKKAQTVAVTKTVFSREVDEDVLTTVTRS